MALRRDAQQNRDRLVARAGELFAADGIGVPVEEITRRAGVGMGTLYRHFPTKADLVDAVLEEALEAYVGLARDAAAAVDAWAGFTDFLERGLELHASNRGLMDVILTSARGRARAEATRERVRPLLRQLVARAQAEGRLREDFSAEDVPLLFRALGRVIEATGDSAPDLWRRYLALVVDGLRAAAATPLPVAPPTAEQVRRLS
jgi:AcrR family transcriptional regulator